jgi:hypothetical protein
MPSFLQSGFELAADGLKLFWEHFYGLLFMAGSFRSLAVSRKAR